MNTPSIVALTLILAGLLSAAVATLLSPPRTPALAGGAAPDELAALRQSLQRVEARQDELAAALERAELDGGGRPAAARISVSDIEAAVRRYFEQQGRAAGSAADHGEDSPSVSAEELVARLFGGELESLAREELWQELRDQGRMDEILALMEERAEADPNDPQKQLDLGVAYLEKIQEVGNGPLAGVYAEKADAAFDRVLTLDENHWDARFHKAVALSFWPPIFGKQSESIHQFEILVSQQETETLVPRHVRTHLLLGNMYQQMGDPEKAVAAWKRGLELFPGDPDLAAQLTLAGH